MDERTVVWGPSPCRHARVDYGTRLFLEDQRTHVSLPRVRNKDSRSNSRGRLGEAAQLLKLLDRQFAENGGVW